MDEDDLACYESFAKLYLIGKKSIGLVCFSLSPFKKKKKISLGKSLFYGFG